MTGSGQDAAYAVQAKTYAQQALQGQGGYEYRLGAEREIENICLMLGGVVFDHTGKPLKSSSGELLVREELRVMNQTGVEHVRGFLYRQVGKITHLSKYRDEYRLDRTMKVVSQSLLDMITMNRKKWEMSPRPSSLVWDLITFVKESKQRSVGGFENDNISKIHQITESVQRERQGERRGWFSSLTGKRHEDVGGGYYG